MDFWVLVVILVAVQPLVGWWRFRRFVGGARVVATHRKLRLYAMIVATQWTLVALCAWVLRRRQLDVADLGLVAPGPAWTWGAAAVFGAVLMTATAIAVRNLRRGSSKELPSHLRSVARILPILPLERAGFVPVALTAGICEETLYRGFLTFAFLQLVPSMPTALALSTIAFGIGHLYQGPRGVLATALLGAFLAALYWVSGSLWPGIALHAAVDVVNGNALGSLNQLPEAEAPALTASGVADHTDGQTGGSPPLERTTGT